MKGTLMIHEGDEFEDNGSVVRKIRIDGKHFGDFDVSVFVPSEGGEDWIPAGTAILTKTEVALIAGARRVVFADEEEAE